MSKARGEEFVNTFLVWAQTQSKSDIEAITYGGRLNRTDLQAAIGCSGNALKPKTGNKQLLQEIERFENKLREVNWLPPLSDKGKAKQESHTPKRYDSSENEVVKLKARNAELERDLMEAKAEIAGLKKANKKFKEMSQYIAEMGVMPR